MNLFDIIDDETNTNEFNKTQLDQYFNCGHNPRSFLSNEYNYNEDDDHSKTIVIRHNLSNENQSQSSPIVDGKRPLSTPSHSQSPIKKKIANSLSNYQVCDAEDPLPYYMTIRHHWFRQWLEVHTDMIVGLTWNEIQELMYVHHQIELCLMKQYVHEYYLLSGDGLLIDIDNSFGSVANIDLRVWPSQMITSMLERRTTTTSDLSTDDVACRKYVHKRLQTIKENLDFYRQRWSSLVDQHEPMLTTSLITEIQSYVFTYGIRPLQIKRDLTIEIVQFDARKTIFERCFMALQPSELQINLTNTVCELKSRMDRAFFDLQELKQRIFYQKPPTSMDVMDKTLNDGKPFEECFIQNRKYQSMMHSIECAEQQYDHARKQFEQKLSQLRDFVRDQRLLTIIERRLENMTTKYRAFYQSRVDYHLRESLDDAQAGDIQRITFGPSILTGIRTSLTDDERRLLNRGPSYHLTCQTLTNVGTTLSIDDHHKKQYASIQSRLAAIFSKYQVNIAHGIDLSRRLYQKFRSISITNIPNDLKTRISHEKSLVESICQRSLNENWLIQRTADDRNVFFIDDTIECSRRTSHQIQRMNYIEILFADVNSTELNNDLQETIFSINDQIHTLKQQKRLTSLVADRLEIVANKVRLPYLYFLPKLSSTTDRIDTITMEPRFMFHSSPTLKIASFLQRNLQPFVDRIQNSVRFSSDENFMRKLLEYTYTKQYLKASTLFCLIRIKNFHHLATHLTMIEAFGYYLQENLATNRLGQISIPTLQTLLQLYLYNNHFCYGTSVYTITKGSPSNIPLSTTLAYIYIHAWDMKIRKELDSEREVFGRHENQLFFTWNRSKESLERLLEQLRLQYANIEFEYRIDTTIIYDDTVEIENRQGQLYTRINHDSFLQSHTLPHVIEHMKRQHADILRSKLDRAICYCSKVEDFQRERLHIETTYLANGYSLNFVDRHVQHFFDYFQCKNMRYSIEPNAYHSFRSRWFDVMKKNQTLIRQFHQMDIDELVLRFDYQYELGPRCEFEEFFSRTWYDCFKEHQQLSKDNIIIRLNSRQMNSLNSLVARYRSFSLTSDTLNT